MEFACAKWRSWQHFANFSFRAPDDDELSIAALEDGLMPSNAEDLAGLPPSGVPVQFSQKAGVESYGLS